MTCRHKAGDPDCGSTVGGYQWLENQRYEEESRRAEEARRNAEREETARKAREAAEKQRREVYESSPQPEDAHVIDMVRVGPHIVVKARYPSCKKCSFEGVKILVYLNVTELQIAKWREYDPHFADAAEVKKRGPHQAPAPAARFPHTAEGWNDAMVYAEFKATGSAGKAKTKVVRECSRCDDQSFGEGNRG